MSQMLSIKNKNKNNILWGKKLESVVPWKKPPPPFIAVSHNGAIIEIPNDPEPEPLSQS